MTQFKITSLLTLGSILSLSMLGAMGVPLESGLPSYREPAARRSACDRSLVQVLESLKRRDRLARGYRTNQIQYVSELEKIYSDAHRIKRLSETLLTISTAIITGTTIFKAGSTYAPQILGGQSLLALIRTVNERLIIGEREKLQFDPAADPLGPAMLYATEDVEFRVNERFMLFDEQHRKLTEVSNKIMSQFSSGFWGRLSDSLTLGEDGDEYTAALLAEAKIRLVIYESEMEYCQRAIVAIRNICVLAKDSRTGVSSRDLSHLIPIL